MRMSKTEEKAKHVPALKTNSKYVDRLLWAQAAYNIAQKQWLEVFLVGYFMHKHDEKHLILFLIPFL